ncbi:thiamine pyrophosphate-binding protein [Auritidibacter sp. NML120636]|uniref:thiamine pyrophosphate-binding protein n=1 Tax=Auritidibacter sp. NML120636 TaxID=2170743 RepID=UPI000D731E45|nr:thiamine pyrophosphate-binding protein [Auritidibacter sp. NML120636]PXA80555.1 thiamine pyrophosphate-binding protein [Auritidibacter sp. NML120636]
MPTVAAVLADALHRHATAFFGLMGNGNAYFIDALHQLGTDIVPVRHEVATVASADAYYRVRQELAVATTTYGPGFTNTLTALAEASLSRIPLILVVGDQPTPGRRPWDIDQVATAASMDVPTLTVEPSNAGTVAISAVEQAVSLQRPVVLAIPNDLATAEVSADGAVIPELTPKAPSPVVDTETIHNMATALREASQPLILGGRGARHCAGALRELAGLLGADVATSAPGRGLFYTDGTDGFTDLGVCGGFAASGSAQRMREADVVLVVGVGLNQFTMAFGEAFGPEAHVIQIDSEPQATHARVNQFLSADSATAVPALLDAYKATTSATESRAKTDNTEDTARELRAYETGTEFGPAGGLDPRALSTRLNELLPPDRIYITDGGHFIGWPNMFFDVSEIDHMILLGTAFQTIGLGFSASVGVAHAAPEKTTVLVTGDGGGMMAFADAESLIRTAKSAVVIVFNDAAYGAEVFQYGSKGLAEEPMRVGEIDFAGLATSLGARASVIRSFNDLKDFTQWVADGAHGTFVLDCRVDGSIVAPYMQEIAGI